MEILICTRPVTVSVDRKLEPSSNLATSECLATPIPDEILKFNGWTDPLEFASAGRMSKSKISIDKFRRLLSAAVLCMSVIFSQFAHAETTIDSAAVLEAVVTVSAYSALENRDHPVADNHGSSDHQHSKKSMGGKCSTDCPFVFVPYDGPRTSDRMPVTRKLFFASNSLTGNFPASDDRPPRI